MPANCEVLGWSVGMNRFHDETGIYHLIVLDKGAIQTRNACGSKSRTSGQVQKTVEPQRQCGTCAKISARANAN